MTGILDKDFGNPASTPSECACRGRDAHTAAPHPTATARLSLRRLGLVPEMASPPSALAPLMPEP